MDNNNEVINDNNKVSKVFKYLKLKVKLKRVLSKIWINKQCLDNNVIPKYVTAQMGRPVSYTHLFQPLTQISSLNIFIFL